jgi:two-component system, OmpR family, KDP operon response regulator KdpE
MRTMSEGPLPLRILVVEDESANLELVRASLDSLGDPFLRSSIIVGASSLGEARAALAEKVFDLVLLDLWLPDGDGLSLAREVRATGRKKPLIVVISGSAQPAEQAAALKTADEFLLKPFEPASLVATIDRLVGRR